MVAPFAGAVSVAIEGGEADKSGRPEKSVAATQATKAQTAF